MSKTKLKDWSEQLFWNFTFMLLAGILLAILHIYLSTVVNISFNGIQLEKEIQQAEEFAKQGSTFVTRTGRLIIKDYSLDAYSLIKRKEVNETFALVFFFIVFFPFLLVVSYHLLQRISQLPVHRNSSLIISSLLAVSYFTYLEVHNFINTNDGLVFISIIVPFITITLFFTFFILISPTEKVSPYYRSRTELIPDETLMAA